jgi:L-fuconate dehydratase
MCTRDISHLHENFLYPVSINTEGRYNVPQGEKVGYSIEM